MTDATVCNIEGIFRLGNQPEMRYTKAGQAVTSFSAAANREWKNANGEKQKETTWVRVSCWGKLAEIANQYLHKGQLIYLEGRLNADPKTGGPRVWEGNDGPRAAFEVTANTVRFLSKTEPVAETPFDGPMVETAKELGGVEQPDF